MLSLGRTAEINQLKGGDMAIIEDLDALPSTDDHIGAQGPQKYEQMGNDAMEALIHAQLDGADLTKLEALLVIDMRVRTAEFLVALLSMRASYSKPIYYAGFCESTAEKQWVDATMQTKLTQLIGNKMLSIPGFAPKAIDIPPEMLGTAPEPPRLSKLILGGKKAHNRKFHRS